MLLSLENYTLKEKILWKIHQRNILDFFSGNEVRLRGAYFVKCTDVIKDEEGNVIEIHCT